MDGIDARNVAAMPMPCRVAPLGIVVRIKEEYGTIEEDEIQETDLR